MLGLTNKLYGHIYDKLEFLRPHFLCWDFARSYPDDNALFYQQIMS